VKPLFASDNAVASPPIPGHVSVGRFGEWVIKGGLPAPTITMWRFLSILKDVKSSGPEAFDVRTS
jgi:hypothetical protein